MTGPGNTGPVYLEEGGSEKLVSIHPNLLWDTLSLCSANISCISSGVILSLYSEGIDKYPGVTMNIVRLAPISFYSVALFPGVGFVM